MNTRTLIGVVVAILALGAIAFFFWKSGDSAASAPSYSVKIAPGEQIASWNFQGAYTGNAELAARAAVEIKRLKGMLGTGQFTDYQLFISIANQYDLLGDGENELAYLEKALALDSTATGLAWYNAGQLFTRLGAYATARIAFERAVAAQPFRQYQQALLDFLNAHYPEDASAISKQGKATADAPSGDSQ